MLIFSQNAERLGLRTVSLHGGNEVSVQEEVHVGEVRGGTSVHHHLVQHLKHTRGDGTETNLDKTAQSLRIKCFCQRDAAPKERWDSCQDLGLSQYCVIYGINTLQMKNK